MKFLKGPIEQKLSAALGARVTIDALNVSLLGGSLDVTGVTVTAHDAAEPVLRVRRVKAEIAVGAMLRKEVVVRSLVVEGPLVTIVRAADGTLNLPQRDGSRATPAPAAVEDDAGEEQEDAPSAWKLAAEKVQLLDGAVHYRDGDYHVSAERIVGELLQKPDGIHVTVLAASAGRRDELLDLGEARAHCVFRATDIAKLPTAPLKGSVEVGDAIHATITSPALAERRGDVEVRADLTLASLLKLLPPKVAPNVRLAGQANLHVVASLDAKQGLRMTSLVLSASDVIARAARDDHQT